MLEILQNGPSYKTMLVSDFLLSKKKIISFIEKILKHNMLSNK